MKPRVPTRDIVQKLWSLCDVLRDDGITYQAYVTELTYLLFLKMLEETDRESVVPLHYRWSSLTGRDGEDLMRHYRTLLSTLGSKARGALRDIFVDAQTSLRRPANLKELVTQIDRIDWYSAQKEGLGELYEGLLERNASEKKSGAGQYFTPRPLIDCMVDLLQPELHEVIQDPAAGTGGFFVAADRYIKSRTSHVSTRRKEQHFSGGGLYRGLELVHETHRLLLMNLLLHGIESGGVRAGDALGPDGEALGAADIVLTNPPFGTKKGGRRPIRSDFTITAESSNKQLAFIEHIVGALKRGGRAGIVVPDNVLFGDGAGGELRSWLMELCELHTILRLPTGIFYAQGVKTNVLFLRRARKDTGGTKEVWVYDMRAAQPAFGKSRPLRHADFEDFKIAYGRDKNGGAPRPDRGPAARFRRFDREEIRARGDNLDIAWLRPRDEAAEDALEDPQDIADAIQSHLQRALTEMENLTRDGADSSQVRG